MKVLLTGGSGTVGREILKTLCIHKTYDITAFDLNNRSSKNFYKPYRNKINVKLGDLTERRDIEAVCRNIDFVIHLAAIIPPLADKKPELAYRVNTLGTYNLIRSLEKHSQDAFFLFASSVSVYGDRIENPQIKVNDALHPSKRDGYAKTKIKAEQLVRKSKLDWSIFRLSAILGTNNLKFSGLMFHMPLKTSFEITTPKDTSRAFVKALTKREHLSKKVFNLGGGERCRITYENFLSKSFSILGLGRLNFPKKTFAEKNFHCGFYADGYKLEGLLNYRRDSLDTYFKELKNSVSKLKKATFYLLKSLIKKYLLSLSDPYKAYQRKEKSELKHFFN